LNVKFVAFYKKKKRRCLKNNKNYSTEREKGNRHKGTEAQRDFR